MPVTFVDQHLVIAIYKLQIFYVVNVVVVLVTLKASRLGNCGE